MTSRVENAWQSGNPIPAPIIFDTSPLILIDRLGYLPALQDLHHEIIIPGAVSLELRERKGLHGARVPDFEWVNVLDPQSYLLRQVLGGPPSIDSGEAAAIALALEQATTVVLDDLDARKRAQRLGVDVTGTIGQVLALHRVGLAGRYSSRNLKEDLHALRRAGMHIREDLLRHILDISESN